MLLVVILTEFRGSASLTLFEDAVEIADIVEPAGIAHLYDGHSAVGQQTRGIPQAHVNNVFGNALPRTNLEETAEGCRGHRGQFRQGIQTDFLAEICIDILLDTPHPAAVDHIFGTCKSAGGKQMIVGRLRQFIEELKELHHTVETRFHVHQFIEAPIDVHDGFHIESDARGGMLEHEGDGLQKRLGKQRFRKETL